MVKTGCVCPGSDHRRVHTCFLLTFYWSRGHTWLQGVLGNLVFGWGVPGLKKKNRLWEENQQWPTAWDQSWARLHLWLSPNILQIKRALKCECEVNINLISSVLDLSDNEMVKYEGELKWGRIDTKLLDFLGQHFKKTFYIRNIANVHKSRGNSVTNLHVLTKLQLFSTHGQSCFVQRPGYQGVSHSQLMGRHTPGPCDHCYHTCHHLFFKLNHLPTILRDRHYHFAGEEIWKQCLSNLPNTTQ